MGDKPNQQGLSRKHILHDVIRAGKARYIDASSMYAWQFAKALFTADLHGWTHFVPMQNHYNLIYREEEREMIPLCVDQGIGIIPRATLALAWMLHKPGLTCPIVGTSKAQHLEEAVAAVGVKLGQEDIASLEEPYRPKRVLGFS